MLRHFGFIIICAQAQPKCFFYVRRHAIIARSSRRINSLLRVERSLLTEPGRAHRARLSHPVFVYAFLFLVLSSLWFLIAARFSQSGWDFTQFYIAAKLPIRALYDRAAFTQFGDSYLAPLGIRYYPPYVRPAVFALAFKPLSLFSYWSAYWLWVSVGFGAYFASVLLLVRRFSLPHALLPAFAFFFPAMFAFVLGQDAAVFLLALVATLLLLESGRDVAAGLVLALCLYKFNLILFIPFVLVAKARWRSLSTLAVTGCALAAFSALLAPPTRYVALLRSIPRETIAFLPGGLRGLAIRYGHESVYYPLAALGAMFCLYLIWKLPLTEALAVAAVAGLLFAYHGTGYDRTLLIIPIAIVWHSAGPVVRFFLLLPLLLPFPWFMAKDAFQVTVEVGLLIQLYRLTSVDRSDCGSSGSASAQVPCGI